MNEARWLKTRILAALSVPALTGGLGCSGQPVISQKTSSSTASQEAKLNALCASWRKGRSFTWCTTTKEAQSLARDKSSLSLNCPSQLDHSKVAEALKEQPFERGTPRRTDIILLHEKTKTASSDCKEGVCCYVWATKGRGGRSEIIRGRPLLEAGDAQLAPITAGRAWTGSEVLPAMGLSLSASERDLVASYWLQAGLAEHASVASFSRATLELMALGAPAELIRDTSQGALDEIDHATRCFRIAEAYGTSARAPGALPITATRSTEVEDVALHTFVEGCVVETIAALEAVVAAQKISNESLRSHATAIAEDEVRHSEVAWRTLTWLLTLSPEATSESLRAVRSDVRKRTLEIGQSPEGLERHGILTSETRLNVASDAWEEIIDPALVELGIYTANGVS